MATDLKECQLCIKKRVSDGEEPNRMVALPKLTKKHRLQVFVCPDCDGAALTLGKGSIDESN